MLLRFSNSKAEPTVVQITGLAIYVSRAGTVTLSFLALSYGLEVRQGKSSPKMLYLLGSGFSGYEIHDKSSSF